MPHNQQRRVLFTGQVQGVGFRYTTHRIAAGHDITGFVRNLEDGRVELIAEGPRTEIDAMLLEIRDHFAGHIRSESEATGPASGNYPTFEIRR